MFVFFQLLGCSRCSCRGATGEKTRGWGSGNHHDLESQNVQQNMWCMYVSIYLYSRVLSYIFIYIYIVWCVSQAHLRGHCYCWWPGLVQSCLNLECARMRQKGPNTQCRRQEGCLCIFFAHVGLSENTHWMLIFIYCIYEILYICVCVWNVFTKYTYILHTYIYITIHMYIH